MNPHDDTISFQRFIQCMMIIVVQMCLVLSLVKEGTADRVSSRAVRSMSNLLIYVCMRKAPS